MARFRIPDRYLRGLEILGTLEGDQLAQVVRAIEEKPTLSESDLRAVFEGAAVAESSEAATAFLSLYSIGQYFELGPSELAKELLLALESQISGTVGLSEEALTRLLSVEEMATRAKALTIASFNESRRLQRRR